MSAFLLENKMLEWGPDEDFKINTAFEMLGMSGIQIAELRSHLKDHKYFIEKEFNVEITYSEAFASWAEYIRDPAFFFYKKYKFAEKTGIEWPEALKYITDGWHFMKEKDPFVQIDEAVKQIIHEKTNANR